MSSLNRVMQGGNNVSIDKSVHLHLKSEQRVMKSFLPAGIGAGEDSVGYTQLANLNQNENTKQNLRYSMAVSAARVRGWRVAVKRLL